MSAQDAENHATLWGASGFLALAASPLPPKAAQHAFKAVYGACFGMCNEWRWPDPVLPSLKSTEAQ